ncbi:MAG: hypothetical protein QE278_06745 [Limnobacter sp.]|nr:hypothetical protein [Limnobacter sp.]
MGAAHHVQIDLQTLITLVQEVEREDPIDYGSLPIDEAELRQACCAGALNILQSAALFEAEDVLYVLLSSMAKLLEENVLLHAQNLERGEGINNYMVKQILEHAKRPK